MFTLEGSTISFCFYPELSIFSFVLFSAGIVITSVRLVTLAGANAVSFYTFMLAIVRFGCIIMEVFTKTVRLDVTVKFGEGSIKMLFGM